jgi:hypothetical protein
MKSFRLLILAFVLITLISGCATGLFPLGGSGQQVKSAMLGITTFNNRGAISSYVYSAGASSDNIGEISPKTLKLPGGSSLDYSNVSGTVITCQNYYIGPSTTSLGEITDPLTETNQRQLYLQSNLTEPLNGIYTATFGSKTKEIDLAQTSYLPAINLSEVFTGAGYEHLNVTNGDFITLINQSNPNYRFLCRIYDTLGTNNQYQNYWTSTDIRGIDWTDSDSAGNFFKLDLQMPQGNQVVFSVPGGILNKGSQNLLVRITAYDTSGIVSDTSGSFSTLILPSTEIDIVMSGD